MRPLVTGQLRRAASTHDSPYGPIAVSWRLDGDTFELELDVPAGVTAHLDLPLAQSPRTVGAGSHRVVGAWVPVGRSPAEPCSPR